MRNEKTILVASAYQSLPKKVKNFFGQSFGGNRSLNILNLLVKF